jgi:hypothetical protein
MAIAVRTRAVPGDAAARRTLRAQVARLDAELGELAASAWPQALPRRTAPPIPARAGATLLTLAQLERTRDSLAADAAAARRHLDERGRAHEQALRTREEMLLDPRRHRFARVTNADAGERGCGGWHVQPRYGAFGMLMGWWRVVVSSGCPLAAPPAGGCR